MRSKGTSVPVFQKVLTVTFKPITITLGVESVSYHLTPFYHFWVWTMLSKGTSVPVFQKVLTVTFKPFTFITYTYLLTWKPEMNLISMYIVRHLSSNWALWQNQFFIYLYRYLNRNLTHGNFWLVAQKFLAPDWLRQLSS